MGFETGRRALESVDKIIIGLKLNPKKSYQTCRQKNKSFSVKGDKITAAGRYAFVKSNTCCKTGEG